MSGITSMVGQHCGSSPSPCQMAGLASSSSICQVAGLRSRAASSSMCQATRRVGYGVLAMETQSLSNDFPKLGRSAQGLRKGDGFFTEMSGSRRRTCCQAFYEDEEFGNSDGVRAQGREMLSRSGSGEQSFFDRVVLAWSILFPKKRKSTSHAEVAKQRLKMILISDRCSVNDDAKRRIVNKIVGALSDFVEVESADRVQLTVSSDFNLGTVYSITVPVRRVKPEFQEYSRELQNVALTEEFDEEFRFLDIKLDYQYPEEDEIVDNRPGDSGSRARGVF